MNLGENLAKKIYKNKKVLILLTAIAIIVVGGAVYIKFGQRHYGTDTTTQTHSTATKQYAATSDSGKTNGTAGKSSASPSSNGQSAGSNGSLPAPTGQLLNKQAISLSSGSPETNADIESICQTIAQATCDIRLTGPNGQVKTVGARNTGSSGAVIFDWNAQTVGLTPGKWAVQAVATQNNQTGTSHTEYLQVQS